MCERYINHQSVTFHMPTHGGLAHNTGMCPDQELNWRPFGSQASTQFTEPHQPGLLYWSYTGVCIKTIMEIKGL